MEGQNLEKEENYDLIDVLMDNNNPQFEDQFLSTRRKFMNAKVNFNA
jgi:hypothetical protein